MGLKDAIQNRVVRWVLEDSPLIGWVNGYKTIIGNTLTVASLVVLGIQQGLLQTGICPAWEYCGFIDGGYAVIGFLLGLLTRYVGKAHKEVKGE